MRRCSRSMRLSTVADALPGLGIVAAVLGVVITMGALGGPPEEIGEQGGGGAGGDVSGHSAVLRSGGSAEREHDARRPMSTTTICMCCGC